MGYDQFGVINKIKWTWPQLKSQCYVLSTASATYGIWLFSLKFGFPGPWQGHIYVRFTCLWFIWSQIKSTYCVSKPWDFSVLIKVNGPCYLIILHMKKKKPPRLRKHCLIIIANKLFLMLTLVRCTTFANKLLLTKIATIVYPSKAQKNTAFIFQHWNVTLENQGN